MPKKLNTDSIVNELRGASSFFSQARNETLSEEPQTTVQDETKQTEKPNASTERSKRTVLEEIENGPTPLPMRETSRYSFEIYDDQKQSIEDLQYLFKKKTGKKLSSSRIIREAIDEFLREALGKLDKS
jgi:hypothetical protein